MQPRLFLIGGFLLLAAVIAGSMLPSSSDQLAQFNPPGVDGGGEANQTNSDARASSGGGWSDPNTYCDPGQWNGCTLTEDQNGECQIWEGPAGCYEYGGVCGSPKCRGQCYRRVNCPASQASSNPAGPPPNSTPTNSEGSEGSSAVSSAASSRSSVRSSSRSSAIFQPPQSSSRRFYCCIIDPINLNSCVMYQEPQDTECPDGAESYETNKDCLMHCVMPQSSSAQSLPPDQECKPSFQCSIVANNGSCAESAFNCFCGGVITDTQGCSMTINDGGENVTCTGSCRKCAPCSSSASSTLSVPPGCGNGRREASEECDDGNKVGGDGCSASCTLEDGGYCRQLP